MIQYQSIEHYIIILFQIYVLNVCSFVADGLYCGSEYGLIETVAKSQVEL